MFPHHEKNPRATVDAFLNLMFHTGDPGYCDEDVLAHYGGLRGGALGP